MCVCIKFSLGSRVIMFSRFTLRSLCPRSICIIAIISHFGFEGKTLVMIQPVPSHCSKARFTSALRQPCTCLRTHFWGISCGSLKTILRFARPQGCRNVVRRIFNMFIFLAFFGRCLEVARQLQGSLEMTARLTYEVILGQQLIKPCVCLTKAAG